MSNPKNPPAAGFPPEPPELAAERERLLPELEKHSKTTTGTTQAVLRKLHDLLVHTRPGAPIDFQLYADAKVAFERFAKDPVLPVPAVVNQCLEFMQKRLVALGFTGQMQLPKGAPPPPPGMVNPAAAVTTGSAPAPAASAAPRGGAKDGFEGTGRTSSVSLNPVSGTPLSVDQGKGESESSPAKLKNPGVGNLKG
jgi:hypothetical protein